MIEKVILDYLKSELSLPVFLKTPVNPPKTYVIFEKTSGSKQNRLSSATFAFQSYAESMYQAATLNEQLKKVIEEMIKLSEISSVYLNSDYNFTDIQTKQYRYQAVFDIFYY